MSKRSVGRVGAGLALLAVGISPATLAQAGPATTPFSCAPDFYQIAIDQLVLVLFDTSVSPAPVTYQNVGDANSSRINAIGYNYDDDFIYGIEVIVDGASVTANNLLKIDASGNRENLGPVTNLPAANYIAGDYDGNGHWIVSSNLGTAYSIDLETMEATSIGTLSPAPADFAIINYARIGLGTAITGYFASGTNLYSFDAASPSTSVALVGSMGADSISGGAMWADASGRVTSFDNGTGRYFVIADPNSLSPASTLIAEGVGLTSNDGAFCLLARSPFSPPSPPPDSDIEFDIDLDHYLRRAAEETELPNTL